MFSRVRWVQRLTAEGNACMTRPAVSIATSSPLPSASPLFYLSRIAAVLATAIGGSVIIGGWLFDITSLRSLLPGFATMKFNTAFALVSCGSALWLLGSEVHGARRRVGHVFAIVAVMIGVFTLLEYIFHWNLGIDEWVFIDKDSHTGNLFPGRPSPNTALAISFIGLALLLTQHKTYVLRRMAEWLGLAAGLIAYIGLVGYAYDVRGLYGIYAYSTLGLHTAVALLILSLGVLMMRPDGSLLTVISTATAGGLMARRLLPAALLIPPVLGWLQILGANAGFYNFEIGLALFSTAIVVIFTMIIWYNANSLTTLDRHRWQAQEDLRRVNAELESRVVARTAELAKANDDLRAEISERKRAEAKFHNLLKSAPDAIVTVDDQGRIVLVSEQAEKYFGYSQEELHGQSIEILLPESLRDRHVGHRAHFLNDPHTRYMGIGLELSGRRKDGTTFPVEISLSPLKIDEDGYLITSIIRDITEHKKAEQALRNYATQLEAVNKELEAFSYSVSHDLRAPLRALDGFSHVLLEDYADKLDDDGRNYLKRVRSAAGRMAALIDDLIKLSRVTRNELNVVKVDLSRLAEEIAQELRESEPKRQVEFAISPGLVTSGDPHLLRVALENLLANAWKFTSLSNEARIELSQEEQNGKVVYKVRDNGVGFDMEYAGKLFGAFQRLHDQKEFPGTGIGLATVQRVITRHGGRVWAEGAMGQGAGFYFTL